MLELEIFSILTATLTSSVALRSVSIWLEQRRIEVPLHPQAAQVRVRINVTGAQEELCRRAVHGLVALAQVAAAVIHILRHIHPNAAEGITDLGQPL